MGTDPNSDSPPAPPIPAFAAAPHVLLRINPLRVAGRDGTDADADRARLVEMHELSAAQEQAEEKLSDLLYATGGRTDRQTRQGIVLPLRRAIHNRRLPRGLSRDRIRTVVDEPAIEAWLDNQERLVLLREELTGAHEDRLLAERAELRSLLGDEDLRRSLVMSSELLPDAADKYRAAPWEQVKKNTRKSEESLLRYAMRARTKTSPFSRYTVAGFLPEHTPEDTSGIGAVRSAMEFNRGLLRRMEGRLGRIPAVRGAMRFHPSAGLRLEDGKFTAVGNKDQLGAEAAEIAARYGEAKVTVPANPASIALVEWLRSTPRRSATFTELAEVITARVPGATAAVATAFVAKLCDFGVLVPEPIVDDQTPDALRKLADWLADFTAEPVAADVKAHLDRVCEAQERFAEAGPAERVALLRKGKASSAAALEALGEDPGAVSGAEPIWFEDGVLDPACSSADDWRPVLDDCRRLLDLLQIFDEQHVFSRVLTHRFTARYGRGGRCEDLDGLGELFVPAYDDALQITEGLDHELAATDPVLSRLVPLRAGIVSRLAEQLLHPPAHADPSSPVDIDPELCALAVREAPAWVGASPASYGMFMQPLGGNPPTGAILNKIYNGWGNYVSRFLAYADGPVVDRARRMVREHHGPGVTAEIRPVQGFNANLHPLLAERDLDWDNTGAPERLSLERLVVRHDPASDRVMLWDPEGDCRVHPLYLGFLIPFYLPSRLLSLTVMGGSGSIFFEPQVSADRSPTVDRSRVRHYRGLRFGSVWLARARWHIPSGTMPRPEPGEAEADFFVRLNEWRVRLGIPDHVFLHPPAPELSPGRVNSYFGSYMDNRKPQYVDLLSRLHVRHLDRLLAHQPGSDIVVEEARPGPDERFPVGESAHAAEVVAEFYRKANP